jgi:hypothetical protein
MKWLMWALDFIMLALLGLSAGITYSPAVGFCVFFALTYLHEIKEAVQKGSSK